jgi:hypothetical protein
MVLIALDNFVLLPKLLGWKTADVQDQALLITYHVPFHILAQQLFASQL